MAERLAKARAARQRSQDMRVGHSPESTDAGRPWFKGSSSPQNPEQSSDAGPAAYRKYVADTQAGGRAAVPADSKSTEEPAPAPEPAAAPAKGKGKGKGKGPPSGAGPGLSKAQLDQMSAASSAPAVDARPPAPAFSANDLLGGASRLKKAKPKEEPKEEPAPAPEPAATPEAGASSGTATIIDRTGNTRKVPMLGASLAGLKDSQGNVKTPRGARESVQYAATPRTATPRSATPRGAATRSTTACGGSPRDTPASQPAHTPPSSSRSGRKIGGKASTGSSRRGSPRRQLNAQGQPMTGREYARMYGAWMAEDDPDAPPVKVKGSPRGDTYGASLVAQRQEAAQQRQEAAIQKRQRQRALAEKKSADIQAQEGVSSPMADKVEGSGTFATFYNRQVDLQHRRERKIQEGKIEALTEEVSLASPRPTISGRSKRMAANQPELCAVYDEVRKEREQQREILVLLNTPRAPATQIAHSNDALYFQHKDWDKSRKDKLEAIRERKAQQAKGAVDQCDFTPRILDTSGKRHPVPVEKRLFTPRPVVGQCVGWVKEQLKAKNMTNDQGRVIRASLAKMSEAEASHFIAEAKSFGNGDKDAMGSFIEAHSQLSTADEPTERAKGVPSQVDEIQQIEARIAGIKRRQQDRLYQNNQIQRKMAHELAQLEQNLAQAKAQLEADQKTPKVPVLSNNDKQYMSKKAIMRYKKKMGL